MVDFPIRSKTQGVPHLRHFLYHFKLHRMTLLNDGHAAVVIDTVESLNFSVDQEMLAFEVDGLVQLQKLIDYLFVSDTEYVCF